MSFIQREKTSIGIVGAGLAGILVAQACMDQGLEIAWIIDGNDALRGSGSPTALFHPFPGRSMKLHPLLGDAVTAAQRIFFQWKQRYPKLVRETSMVRSFMGLGGSRVKETFEKTYIRDGIEIPSWLKLELLDERGMAGAGFVCDPAAGGIVYTPAMSIDLSEIVMAEQKRLLVQILDEPIQKFTYSQQWSIGDNLRKNGFAADIIVLCLGRGMNHLFPNLRLGEYGGELIVCDLSSEFDEIYSANGRHIGRHHSGKYVFGSSRWLPDQKPLLSDVQQELENDITKIFPHVHKTTNDTSIWRGYRSVYHSDRLPIAGKIPNLQQVYTCCALGSKGLLWGALSAQYCVQQIQKQLMHKSKNQQDLDQSQREEDIYKKYLSTERILEERWIYKDTLILESQKTKSQL